MAKAEAPIEGTTDTVQAPVDANVQEGTDIESAVPNAVERPALSALTSVNFAPGQVDVKKFTAADLGRMGINPKSDDDLVWNRANNFSVPISSLNAETVDALIKLPGFSAV